MLRTLNTSLRKKREDQGFTLIELLVVILIIGILAAIVVVAVRGTTGDASKNACSQSANALSSALDRYLTDNNDVIADPASVAAGTKTTPTNAPTKTYTDIYAYTKAEVEGLLVPTYLKSAPSDQGDNAVLAVKAISATGTVYGALCQAADGTNAGL